jgi:DNA-binding HxlR family transcriptional regulator
MTTPTGPPTSAPASPATTDHGAGIETVAAVVGDRWSMLIVRNVFRGIRRFDALHDDLGVSRPVLAGRLKRLIDAGILERRRYQDHPPRDDYVLTTAGLELSPALVALIRWGDRWFGEGERTAVLVHAECGDEFEQGFWCRTCKATFGPADIRSKA